GAVLVVVRAHLDVDRAGRVVAAARARRRAGGGLVRAGAVEVPLVLRDRPVRIGGPGGAEVHFLAGLDRVRRGAQFRLRAPVAAEAGEVLGDRARVERAV